MEMFNPLVSICEILKIKIINVYEQFLQNIVNPISNFESKDCCCRLIRLE